jgi:hypothetical protein
LLGAARRHRKVPEMAESNLMTLPKSTIALRSRNRATEDIGFFEPGTSYRMAE